MGGARAARAWVERLETMRSYPRQCAQILGDVISHSDLAAARQLASTVQRAPRRNLELRENQEVIASARVSEFKFGVNSRMATFRAVN